MITTIATEGSEDSQDDIDQECSNLGVNRIFAKVRGVTAECHPGETHMQVVSFSQGLLLFLGFDSRDKGGIGIRIEEANDIRARCVAHYGLKQASQGHILGSGDRVVLNLPIDTTDVHFLNTSIEQPLPLLLLLKSRLGEQQEMDMCTPSSVMTSSVFLGGDKFVALPSGPYAGLRFIHQHWPDIIPLSFLKEESITI